MNRDSVRAAAATIIGARHQSATQMQSGYDKGIVEDKGGLSIRQRIAQSGGECHASHRCCSSGRATDSIGLYTAAGVETGLKPYQRIAVALVFIAAWFPQQRSMLPAKIAITSPVVEAIGSEAESRFSGRISEVTVEVK